MTDLKGKWILDPTHSTVGFTVRHAGISKVRGSFEEVEASVVHDGERGLVEAVAQAASFNSGNESRDAHVRGEDFLAVESYPTLTFSGAFGGEVLSGDLTIHGVTLPVECQVEVFGVAVDPFGAERLGAEAVATISRKDFGLTWNAPLEAGGVLVSDRVQLQLDLSFLRES